MEKKAQLAQIAAACTRAGFIDGRDFAVWGVTEFIGSDMLELGLDGEDFVISSQDRGRRIEFGRSASAAEAQRIFLDEVAEYAGSRGIGPRAGMLRTPDEVLARIMRRRRSPGTQRND